MIFKLSIVVIYFIVAASCMDTQTERPPKSPEEVIKESFQDCLKWTNNGTVPTTGHILTLELLIRYLGGHSDNEITVIEDYFNANPTEIKNITSGINQEIYGAILKLFCEREYPELTFERCGETKKNAGIIRSLEESKRVAPGYSSYTIIDGKFDISI
ncbi:uncharacterized protein LOC126841242 [Adelges cooleyi]|uniref:uncharacterized protein LOC126837511 n=1 Tax=Adelges cooleyi TaxID=133065 RepID=UPI00217FDCB6|nr:uncharacterized protein LOC126837511 [Adelges cooleyi]XP_050433537.1 uncharacterized protein LOC126841242 [Adelges cooleyi]